MALLVTLELAADTTSAAAFDQIGLARESEAPDTPLVRFCRVLDEAGVLDDVEVAVPGDQARAAQLLAVREAVPAAVNQRVGRAKQTIDPRIEKTAADMIVPFDAFESLLAAYDEEFGQRGLDLAVWGHISDGNVHPNVIPRSFADVESGKEAILACGRTAVRLGGSPLAEHGVGRSRVKQRLLEALYGVRAVEEMRRIKRALDPEGRLAPGVLFPPARPRSEVSGPRLALPNQRRKADDGEADDHQPRRHPAEDAGHHIVRPHIVQVGAAERRRHDGLRREGRGNRAEEQRPPAAERHARTNRGAAGVHRHDEGADHARNRRAHHQPQPCNFALAGFANKCQAKRALRAQALHLALLALDLEPSAVTSKGLAEGGDDEAGQTSVQAAEGLGAPSGLGRRLRPWGAP